MELPRKDKTFLLIGGMREDVVWKIWKSCSLLNEFRGREFLPSVFGVELNIR